MSTAGKTASVFLLSLFLFALPLGADEPRTFREIFPGIVASQRRRAFSENGLKRTFLKTEEPSMIPAPDSGIDILSTVMRKQPSHIIETVVVVPHEGRPFDRLDAYNAIANIQNIKEYAFFSARRNANVPVFTESTRLDNERRKNPIPDPPPASMLPNSDTMFLRLRDAAFGNLFIRGDLSMSSYGMTYDMTNFTAVRYLIFTVMRAEKFSAVIYLEPIREGMLIYGMACIDIPDFLMSRLNINSDIERRLTVFVQWIRDGLKAQVQDELSEDEILEDELFPGEELFAETGILEAIPVMDFY